MMSLLTAIAPVGVVNLVLPSFTGTLGAGQTLTYVAGTWRGSPTITHEWLLDGESFPGGARTGATITAADVPAGASISIKETANGVVAVYSAAKYIAMYSTTGMAACWGLRKMVAAFAGSAIDVRRVSDNATLTIGFLANGNLDQAAAWTFRGASELRVSKWYDQSGAGLDLTQASAGAQPRLELYVFNGKPALWFDTASLIFHASNAAFALATDQTVVLVAAGTGTSTYAVSSIDGAPGNGWIVGFQASGKIAYFSSTKGSFTSQASGTVQEGYQHSFIVTREAGTASIYIDGTVNGTATGHGNASAGAFAISGSPVDSTSKADMLCTEVALFSAAVDTTTKDALAANHLSYFDCKTSTQSPTPSIGAHAYKFVASSYFDINAGSTFKWDYTQPWTVEFLVRMRGRSRLKSIAAGVSVSMIVGNMGNSPTAYPGWEVMIDCRGFVFVRLINDYNASAYVGAIGSQNYCDDAWHVGHVTYSGNGLVSGLKFYQDGILDPRVWPEKDLLAAGSIVSTNLSSVGNQVGAITIDGHYFRGAFNWLDICNVERNATYIDAHKTPATLTPANDANCLVSYAFTEGSGAPQDGTGHGYHGVVTGSPVWL